LIKRAIAPALIFTCMAILLFVCLIWISGCSADGYTTSSDWAVGSYMNPFEPKQTRDMIKIIGHEGKNIVDPSYKEMKNYCNKCHCIYLK